MQQTERNKEINKNQSYFKCRSNINHEGYMSINQLMIKWHFINQAASPSGDQRERAREYETPLDTHVCHH